MKKLFVVLVIIWNIGLLLLTGNVYQRNKEYNQQMEYQLASLEAGVATALYLQKNKDTLSYWEQEGLWAYLENIFPVLKK
jgi:hypothetical protein